MFRFWVAGAVFFLLAVNTSLPTNGAELLGSSSDDFVQQFDGHGSVVQFGDFDADQKCHE